MLRIISAQVGQQTPGDLSVPATDQQVLGPYRGIGQLLRKKWQAHQRERSRARWDRNRSWHESRRDVVNGVCRVCGLGLVRDARGRAFCPDPNCNVPRYGVPPIPTSKRI